MFPLKIEGSDDDLNAFRLAWDWGVSLAPEVFKQVDDAPVKEYIDMMARKITLSMRSDLAL